MSRAQSTASRLRSYSVIEQRWFGALLFYTTAPLMLISVLAPPRGLGFWWDAAMMLGLTAAVGLALLPLLSARWWVGHFRSSSFLRLVQSVHRNLTYGAMSLVVLHVLILIVLESRVIEYLKLSASWPMLAGLIAFAVGTALIYTSLDRIRLRWRHRHWRWLHAALSLLMLGMIGWHVIGAGFYFSRIATITSLVWLMSVPTVMTLVLRIVPMIGRTPVSNQSRIRTIPSPHRIVIAIMLCWIAASLLYAFHRIQPLPLSEQSPCQVEPCL
jgi:uncharacterized integral membrane protein